MTKHLIPPFFFSHTLFNSKTKRIKLDFVITVDWRNYWKSLFTHILKINKKVTQTNSFVRLTIGFPSLCCELIQSIFCCSAEKSIASITPYIHIGVVQVSWKKVFSQSVRAFWWGDCAQSSASVIWCRSLWYSHTQYSLHVGVHGKYEQSHSRHSSWLARMR